MQNAGGQTRADGTAAGEVIEVPITAAQELAEVTSLALTVPTVVLGVAVVVIWGPHAWRAIRAGMTRGDEWLVLGVVLGFVGAVGDNLYWGAAWGSKLLGLEGADSLFAHGVYANIPLRQGLGVAAAFCHIKAGQENMPKLRRVLNLLILSSYAIAALGIVLYLALMRGS